MSVNVKESPFNAKGDGRSSDSPAIQAAIDYAYNNNTEVYFPEGIYKIGESIKLPARITIHGANRFRTVLDQMKYCECRLISEITPVFTGGGTESEPFTCKLTMTNIALDNPKLGGNVFEFFNFEDSLIELCIFRGFDNVIVGNLRKLSRIINNTFLATTTSAISNKSIKGAEAWSADSWILNNYFNSTTSRMSEDTIPIYLSRSTSTWIQSNYVDFSYEGIYLFSDRWFKIINNHFGYCYRGIYIDGNTRDTLISQNTFSNISKKQIGRIVRPMPEMGNTDWTCVTINNSHHLDITNNMAGQSDVFITKTGSSTHDIFESGNNLSND